MLNRVQHDNVVRETSPLVAVLDFARTDIVRTDFALAHIAHTDRIKNGYLTSEIAI